MIFLTTFLTRVPTTFNEAAQEVLKQRKYDELMGRAFNLERALMKFLKMIWEWILKNLDLTGLGDVENYRYLKHVFILVFVLLLAWIVWSIFKHFKKTTTLKQSNEEIIEKLQNKALTHEDLMRMAQGFFSSGNIREAVRHNFIASIWILNIKNLINLDSTKTNSQIKRELKRTGEPFLNRFEAIVDTVNRAWFGHKEMNSTDYEAYKLQVETLNQEVLAHEKQ